MQSVETIEAAPEPTEASPSSAPEDVSLADLARNTAEYARAWGSLAASEAALAKVNFIRLAVCALLVPALALGILLGFDALLVALAFRWLQDWSLAVTCVLLLNIAALLGLFALLRRWWRTLSLPRTRAALSRFMEGLR